MAQEKYVAYVSTYTMGDKNGIKIFEVDMEKGRLIKKDQVEITNSSYVTISHNSKYLYSITDFGVEASGLKRMEALWKSTEAALMVCGAATCLRIMRTNFFL